MKKENIFHYILSTVFAVAIVTGASYLYAWEGPRNVPPLDNAPAPINVSPIGQVKQGSLFLDGLNPSNVPYLYGLIVAHGNVGIGTTTPGQKLVVGGKVQIKDGTEGANKVLTSDANGITRWENAGTPSQDTSSHGKKLFTSNGTFTVPEGVTKVWISMSGGGGGGTPNSYTPTVGWSGSGGSGGASIMAREITVPSVNPLPSYQVVVGAAGLHGGYGVGTDGGSSSFGGNLVVASGGMRGGSKSFDGGGSIFGSGGGGAVSGSTALVGANGSGFGGGGGTNGGNGTRGFVLVEW